ncbi:MAG: hypothetical protein KJO41_02085 [Bacteroidia bacterium]|nr:hypothetical protein [Bacteroidia bacterium]NND26583.1 hypothetical protein [Flavobacteriaceae bacterium]MBT8277762.1 hypothetical protein [Bacteroidia bacterium]NNK61445.1 hypothetical protein [Flavobacteriaceae bacterium]NNL33167.1 hypothetical protein [Flavobacteriaceae bacterium]
MKNLLRGVICVMLCSTLYNCSSEPLEEFDSAIVLEDQNSSEDLAACVGNNPEARITNNGTEAIDLDIFDMNGNLLGFVHNLAPGDTSIWISFPTGETLFAVSRDSFEDEKVIYTMNTCMIFDMEVESTNTLSSATPQSI